MICRPGRNNGDAHPRFPARLSRGGASCGREWASGRLAVAFCRGVMERSDGSLDQLNRLWSDESMVPTEAELVAPGLWLARIDLPDIAARREDRRPRRGRHGRRHRAGVHARGRRRRRVTTSRPPRSTTRAPHVTTGRFGLDSAVARGKVDPRRSRRRARAHHVHVVVRRSRRDRPRDRSRARNASS